MNAPHPHFTLGLELHYMPQWIGRQSRCSVFMCVFVVVLSLHIRLFLVLLRSVAVMCRGGPEGKMHRFERLTVHTTRTGCSRESLALVGAQPWPTRCVSRSIFTNDFCRCVTLPLTRRIHPLSVFKLFFQKDKYSSLRR